MRWQWPWAALIALGTACVIAAGASMLAAWRERKASGRNPDLK